VAMGACDGYGYCHYFIASPCAPVVFTPPSYFVDHYPLLVMVCYIFLVFI
jgi:hypothetical protein